MHDTKPTFNEQEALSVGLEESTVSEPVYTSGTTFEAHVETHLFETRKEPDTQQTPTAFQPPSSQSDAQTLIYHSHENESFPQVFGNQDTKDDSFPRVFDDQPSNDDS